ncbi:alpha-1,3-mannosyl-glycoprotein 4-beta-N-acetylglucosaminyltransferase A-like [Anticarsia gemmatalis]|uniref:alpha-1,3-mannosyl-glycoprotein 4-beta-N-acetylglucosaminyltransferase A-like n=1 Tax=Anticarsia gemmatalis TaxID=129554 RepID=UPI003F75F6C6
MFVNTRVRCRVHNSPTMARSWGGLLAPKKRMALFLGLLLFAVFSIVVYTTANSRLERENEMEEMIANLHSHLEYLETQYRGRQEDVLNLQSKIYVDRGNGSTSNQVTTIDLTTTISPEVTALLKNMTGSHAANGVYTKHLAQLRTPFVYQLLPHLMNDANSLKPAYHMRGSRTYADIVIGIPTVKRDKESYLMITLTHLINGMTDEEAETTLIIIFVGEIDLEYVVNTARQIENTFPKQVEQGLIEVLSPSPTYYPDLDRLPITLGDSRKRVKWRTKQNLDTMYLMAYAQSKGIYYLMLEDDVITKKNYIAEIKKFTAATTVNNPTWFFIDYCHVGGIGKLFRSADLLNFITYVQLFYNNMPIDWLLESYLADRVCTIEKSSKACVEEKLRIKPKFKTPLFQHIGLYSSLKGKIQKVKNTKSGTIPTFYPHKNPPLDYVKTDIEEHADHTLKRAYDGQTFFWGVKPRKDNLVEFWFQKPIILERYLFRSGNVEHTSDKFYDTTVEVLPRSYNSLANFTAVGYFDEFGLAEGELKMGAIVAIRLKVRRNSTYWVILSEIELKEINRPADTS